MRARVVWSPVEEEYLKKNMDSATQDQLCIALAKSRSALTKKIKEIKTGVLATPNRLKHQSKIGRRKDLGIFVRSGWEANIMRYFKSKYSRYGAPEYEPELFSFTQWEKPKGQALSYTPDFRVTNKKTKKKYWVEVKGNWLRPQDKTKLRRFKKHYPDDFKNFLVVVGSMNTKTAEFFLDLGVPKKHFLCYNEIKKSYKDKIKNWEL